MTKKLSFILFTIFIGVTFNLSLHALSPKKIAAFGAGGAIGTLGGTIWYKTNKAIYQLNKQKRLRILQEHPEQFTAYRRIPINEIPDSEEEKAERTVLIKRKRYAQALTIFGALGIGAGFLFKEKQTKPDGEPDTPDTSDEQNEIKKYDEKEMIQAQSLIRMTHAMNEQERKKWEWKKGIEELKEIIRSEFTNFLTPDGAPVTEENIEKILKDKKIDSLRNTYGNQVPLLHSAVSDRFIYATKLLIEYGADVKAKNEKASDYTALHYATVSGLKHRDENLGPILKLLINAGADPNAKLSFRSGITPLSFAVARLNKQHIEFLVKNGAKLSINSKNGNTLMHWFAEDTHYVRIKSNVKKRLGENLDYLKKRGLDINAKNNWGNTPLHTSAHNSMYMADTIELFIEKGAQVNARNKKEQTPLHYALGSDENYSSGDKYERIKVLIDSGADVGAEDKVGSTTLHYAMKGRAYKKDLQQIISLLIDKKVDVHKKNNKGQTPLHIAWSTVGIEELVKAGINVNEQDNDGNTPLHIAAEKNRKNIVELLFKHSAYPSIRNNAGKLPDELAQEKGHTQLALFIRTKWKEMTKKSLKSTFMNLFTD